MEASELKKILKQTLKESLREILQEEGLLQTLSENKKVEAKPAPKIIGQLNRQAVQETNEKHKKLTESVQKSKFTASGFDPFAGTKPLTEAQAADKVATSPLDTRDPSDPGVDVSSLIGGNKSTWKALIGGKKK